MNTVLAERSLPTGQTLQIVQGDITAEATDAIVNAANAHLRHGAGVAGAVSRGGGAAIQEESDRWVQTHGPVGHANPAWTSGGQLPAHVVIHAVGPVWGEGDEEAKLSAAVTGSLHLADELKLASLALPAISTGVFGFPKEGAAGIILGALENYFVRNPHSGLQQIRIVLFDGPTLEAFLKAWPK